MNNEIYKNLDIYFEESDTLGTFSLDIMFAPGEILGTIEKGSNDIYIFNVIDKFHEFNFGEMRAITYKIKELNELEETEQIAGSNKYNLNGDI